MDEAEYLRLDCAGSAPSTAGAAAASWPQCSPFTARGPPGPAPSSRRPFLELCDDHGIPRPEVNVHIEGFECDFVWREARLVVETDGAAAHGTDRARGGIPFATRELMTAGWRVWRVSYEQVVRTARRHGRASCAALLRPAPLP